MTEPEVPPAGRSETFRDVVRACLNALITTITLLPILYAAIVNDIPGLLAETLAQAVVVAGIIAKIFRIPMIASWLADHGVGPAPAPPTPAQPLPPA